MIIRSLFNKLLPHGGLVSLFHSGLLVTPVGFVSLKTSALLMIYFSYRLFEYSFS